MTITPTVSTDAEVTPLPATSEPERADLRRMFELITTIKQSDERFRAMLAAGQIRVTYYSPRGQECISAGFGVHLVPTDYCVATYRGLHDAVAKGVPLRRIWAEFLGKSTGPCKGKGGPMHLTDPSVGLMVTTGIVGAGLPIATGLAWACKLRDESQVTTVSFGDGASNIGAFHEALNLASIWQLPVIFICQNNRYGEHSRYESTTSVEHISERGRSYAMPSVTVDGNDPLAVYGAAETAIGRARAGLGPTLVECVTYRFWGHVFGDDMHYMPAEERQAAMDADPAVRYRQRLIEELGFAEDELTSIENAVEAQIDDAVEFAMSSPAPPLEELLTDVYAEGMAR